MHSAPARWTRAIFGLAATVVVLMLTGGRPARATVEVLNPPDFAKMKHDQIWQEARARRIEAQEAAHRKHHKKHHAKTHAKKHAAKPAPKAKHAGTHLRRDDGPDTAAGTTSPRVQQPASVSATLSVPPNVKANDKTGNASSAGQSEQGIAILGQNMLAAWNDGQGFNSNGDLQGASYSSNGGATWTKANPPHPPGTSLTRFWTSDPAISVNEKTGVFYYAGLTQPTSSTLSSGVAISRGHFTGGVFAWDTTFNVRSDPTGALFFDKEWVVADSASGNIYVTYTVFGSCVTCDSILFQRSTDNGYHWSNPVTIDLDDGGTTNLGIQGSRPAVGPDGSVYVTNYEVGVTTADNMVIRKSTNQGAFFGARTVAATEFSNFGTGAPGFNRDRGITFPSIAVDRSQGPNRGRVYMTWNEAVDYFNDIPLSETTVSESENDNFFNRATPFTIGQAPTGNLGVSDLDYWSFSATAGQTYVFYANSVGSTLHYTMRIFCGADTTSRLAYSGNPDSTSESPGAHALIVWTAPTSGTYYLRMANASSKTGLYTIFTNSHTNPGDDRARDQRDAFVNHSDNGTTWSTPVRINDDAALSDNWLPEVGVSQEGFPYAMWFDWRSTFSNCTNASNIYVTRSTDGGSTWAANQVLTSATTNWTSALSNIQPNQGDYNGIYAGGNVAYAWADGRLGDVDVFTAVLGQTGIGGTLTCEPDSAWQQNSNHVPSVTINNSNQIWSNIYTLKLTSARNWPGFPAQSTPSVAANSSSGQTFSVHVPDTAAVGVNPMCFQLLAANGAPLTTCCFNVTVSAATAVGPMGGAAFALRGAWPNPAAGGRLSIAFSLPSGAPATLELIDLLGRRVLSREVGGLGPGTHVVDLSREATSLHAGVYAVRLTQAGRSLTTKIALMR